MDLIWHTDPGHEWLFASNAQLRTLGITSAIFSRYSYRDRNGVYAEGDADAGVLFRAAEGVGIAINHSAERHHQKNAPCRSMARCN